MRQIFQQVVAKGLPASRLWIPRIRRNRYHSPNVIQGSWLWHTANSLDRRARPGNVC